MTVRAIAGPVRPERRVRAARAVRCSGRSAGFSRWADALRLAGVAYLARARGLRDRSGRSCSSSACRSAGGAIVATLAVGTAAVVRRSGVVLGRTPRRAGSATAAGLARAALLATAAGVALIGLVLEALFRSARLQSLRRTTAGPSGSRRRRRSTSSAGSTSRCSRRCPARPTRRSSRSSTRRRSTRWAASTRSRSTSSTGSSSSGPSPRSPAPLRARASGLAAVADARPCARRPALRAGAPDAAGGRRCVDVLFVVRRVLLALWLSRQRSWQLARRRRAARGRDADEARGAPVRRGRARRRAPRRSAGVGRSPAGSAVSAVSRGRRAAVPWRIWYRHRTSAARRRPTSARRVARSVVDSLRLSFDVLFDTRLWSVVPIVALVALGAALVWGDRRAGAVRRALLLGGLLPRRRLGRRTAFRGLPITADEALNPIVRYTGAVVLLAGVARRSCSDSVWRGRRGPDVTRTSARRLAAAAIVVVPLLGYPARRCSPTARRFPSRDDCVRLAPSGTTGALDLVFGRLDTPAEAERALAQVRRRRLRRHRGRRPTAAGAGRSSTTASSRTRRAASGRRGARRRARGAARARPAGLIARA